MDPKLHSPDEVASLLGIKRDTVYRYARSGRLRGIKVGNLWRFPEAEIERFLGRAAVAPDPEPSARAELLPQLLAHAAGGGGELVHGSERLSWAEVDRRSDRLARALVARGLEPGERVVSVLASAPEFVVGAFAVWKARGVLVPEYRGIARDNLLHVLRDARPAALLVDGSVAESLEDVADELPPLRAIYVKDHTFSLSGWAGVEVESLDAALDYEPEGEAPALPGGASPADVASLSYTSGSTGLPKAVLHTHESWIASAEFTASFHELTPGDKVIVPVPLHHGLAFRQILAYLCARASIAIAADVYQALRLLEGERPTALILVPAACNILLDHFASILARADEHLRYLEVGSAPFAPERFGALSALLPTTRIALPYGLTEARVGFVTRSAEGQLNRIASVAPGLELDVVDESGVPVGPGGTGEIRLRGKGLMCGYWSDSEPERAALASHGFRTGDLARVADGEIQLLGRVDDVLKVGGRKVQPAEVETKINGHPDVVESAVVAMPDPEGVFEHALHAFVVPKKGADLNAGELLHHCRRTLESYKIPSRFHVRDSLPKSPVGKLLRRELVGAAS